MTSLPAISNDILFAHTGTIHRLDKFPTLEPKAGRVVVEFPEQDIPEGFDRFQVVDAATFQVEALGCSPALLAHHWNRIARRNRKYSAKVRYVDGTEKDLELVLHRGSDEGEAEYQARFANIVSYKNGVLRGIEEIYEVQEHLLIQGWGLSNCLLLEVGELRDLDD